MKKRILSMAILLSLAACASNGHDTTARTGVREDAEYSTSSRIPARKNAKPVGTDTVTADDARGAGAPATRANN